MNLEPMHRLKLDPVAESSLKIVQLLQEIQKVSKVFNIAMTTHTDESLEAFLQLEPHLQTSIESRLEGTLNIFLEVAHEGVLDCTRETQVRCVKKAIWKYGLFAKGEWEHLVEATDVIEMYDFNNTQIYRNLEFLRVCSFDLLKVMTSEWWMLWDRSEKVIDDLRLWVSNVHKATGPIEVHIPEHLMREKGGERRAFMTRFKWFIPLWRPGQPMPEAFVSLGAGPEIDIRQDEEIRFIGKSFSPTI